MRRSRYRGSGTSFWSVLGVLRGPIFGTFCEEAPVTFSSVITIENSQKSPRTRARNALENEEKSRSVPNLAFCRLLVHFGPFWGLPGGAVRVPFAALFSRRDDTYKRLLCVTTNCRKGGPGGEAKGGIRRCGGSLLDLGFGGICSQKRGFPLVKPHFSKTAAAQP